MKRVSNLDSYHNRISSLSGPPKIRGIKDSGFYSSSYAYGGNVGRLIQGNTIYHWDSKAGRWVDMTHDYDVNSEGLIDVDDYERRNAHYFDNMHFLRQRGSYPQYIDKHLSGYRYFDSTVFSPEQIPVNDVSSALIKTRGDGGWEKTAYGEYVERNKDKYSPSPELVDFVMRPKSFLPLPSDIVPEQSLLPSAGTPVGTLGISFKEYDRRGDNLNFGNRRSKALGVSSDARHSDTHLRNTYASYSDKHLENKRNKYLKIRESLWERAFLDKNADSKDFYLDSSADYNRRASEISCELGQRRRACTIEHRRSAIPVSYSDYRQSVGSRSTNTRDWTHFNRLSAQLQKSKDPVKTIRRYATDATNTRDWTHFNRFVSQLKKDNLI